MRLFDYIAGGFSTIGLAALCLFIFRESLKAMLKRELSKDLANLTHELDVKKEIIKSELHQDAYKAQLMLTNVHAIYPELAAKLEIAFGVVSGLQGARWAIDFSQYNTDDFRSFMEVRHFLRGKQDEFLQRIADDSTKGIKTLEHYLRDIEISEARSKCEEAMNYRVIKGIYCSAAVLQAFDDCHKDLWGAWVDLDIGRQDSTLWKNGVNAIRNVVPPKIDAFRRAIRAELRIET